MTLTRPRAEAAAEALCRHCGQPAGSASDGFCCPGCAAAFSLIEGLGLGGYYRSRVIDVAARPMRPESSADSLTIGRFTTRGRDGVHRLEAMVEGIQCGACVWLIEAVLAREAAVVQGRINMTTRRLGLSWRGEAKEGERLVGLIERLGYRVAPYDPTRLAAADDRIGAGLTRALAVAGFAAGNVMLLSIGVWAGGGEIGTATRDLLHWVSALIALPAIAYAGRPFFQSAWTALRHGRTNMDLPISVGVTLVTGLSLYETAGGGEHAYFDSATMLLFFLLIGRVLDHQARRRARVAAERLVALRAQTVMVLTPDGGAITRPIEAVEPGWRMLVATGERIGVDGLVIKGNAAIDESLITGESLPRAVEAGGRVFAGTLNLGAPLVIEATAVAGSSVLDECVRLMDAAEARRDRFTVLADRVARRYAPVVHLTALATALFWRFELGADWSVALLNATAVLIITCPCALALAVPAVQVITTGRLFRAGILLKSPTALERLGMVDTVVFDKTGTLGEPDLALEETSEATDEAIDAAAALAAASRHPLARSFTRVHPGTGRQTATDIREFPGRGMEGRFPFGVARLGSAEFLGLAADAEPSAPELRLAMPGRAPIRFGFVERPRRDAKATIERLRAIGIATRLLSGDRPAAVATMAAAVGIVDWSARRSPTDKVAALEDLAAAGHRALMVGDGLNDGPALATALVSMSPSTAQDISRNAADVIFQGEGLAPVATVILAARRARAVIRQNIAFAVLYNLTFVPLAIAGQVTPWLAAAAMSSSSIIVLINSFRAGRLS